MTIADLSPIPDVFDRLRADTDFRTALMHRDQARRELRWRLPGWRLDHRLEMRRAIRAWQHYADAVRRIAQ